MKRIPPKAMFAAGMTPVASETLTDPHSSSVETLVEAPQADTLVARSIYCLLEIESAALLLYLSSRLGWQAQLADPRLTCSSEC